MQTRVFNIVIWTVILILFLFTLWGNYQINKMHKQLEDMKLQVAVIEHGYNDMYKVQGYVAWEDAWHEYIALKQSR